MRILYVSQYFPPEMGAPSARVHELSREWVKLGHKVSVLTGFANHPTGHKSPEDRFRLTRRSEINGIDVIRSYVWATPNKGVIKRMISYASFMISASLIGSVRAVRPDVVVATSPQLLCALSGYMLAGRFRVPFIFEVRDLWPESILAVEAMNDSATIRALKKLALFLYTNSHRIVTVGNGYKKEICERYPIRAERIEVVPNGVDADLFVPGPRDNEVRKEFGWGDKFVILYLGTHGMAHALHVTLEAADRLKNLGKLLFVFVGEGAQKEDLKEFARQKRLKNVQFIDHQPKSRVPLFYSACDIGLVTLRNAKLFQNVLPSKIFEYLGMGKPILMSVDGEARSLLAEAEAGWYVPPENAEALTEAILNAYRHQEILGEMGERGRQFVLAKFNREVLAADYLEIMGNVVKKGRQSYDRQMNWSGP